MLVERDADFPDDFADLIDDVRRVRVVLSGAHDGASDDAQLLLAALMVTPDRIGELCADPDGFADRYGYPRWAARSVAKAWSEGLRATATVARAKWTRRVRAVTPETLALLARLTRAPAFPLDEFVAGHPADAARRRPWPTATSWRSSWAAASSWTGGWVT